MASDNSTRQVLKPALLKAGDTIRFVSPSSPLPAEKLQKMVELLVKEGFNVQLGTHALDVDDYLAGTDADRAQDLTDAFTDPEVAAVFCTRGGYGCARLLHFLDLEAMAVSRKLFLGFSDITTLHLALNRRGLPTVHGPMALTLHSDREPWVYESLRAVLRNDLRTPLSAPRAETVVGGTAEGIVTGGCLCLLTDSVGTPNSLDLDGKLLLIEDVDEAPHRIDAMLTHLLNANCFSGVRGIIIGEMTRTDERRDDTIGGKPWKEIVRDRLAPLRVPMVFDFPFGHAKNMLTLPLGLLARLDADAGTLTYLEELCT